MFVSQYDTDENDLIDEREAVKIFKDMADGKQVTGLQEGLKINLKGKKKLRNGRKRQKNWMYLFPKITVYKVLLEIR